MAGQRTRLRFGAVSAEVLLEKTSTKPRAAQHETRRVLVEPAAAPGLHGEALDVETTEVTRSATTDPFGDPVAAPDPVRLDEDHFERRQASAIASMRAQDSADAETFDAPDPERPWDGTNPESRDAITGDAIPPGVPRRTLGVTSQEYVPPETRVEQGVHLETGEWVDLTDRLADVDARTRVDGLEVVRTIPASSYASERVRDAHYLAGVEPESYKVLALLWRALRAERMAAEVRWTKRTAQANGIVVARGDVDRPKTHPPHLLLLELEWAANVRKPTPRVFGPVRAEVADAEVAAAVDLVQSFAAPAPRAELRDERLAKRAELLELARAGKLAEYVPPVEPMPEDVGGEAELAEALALSSAWVREHAPA